MRRDERNDMDYRLMFPHDYLSSADLQGKEVKVVFEEVKVEKLRTPDGEEEHKPVARFKGKDKKLVLNKTNCRTVAGKYGNDTKDWVGKEVTLHATKCKAFGEIVECIRIK